MTALLRVATDFVQTKPTEPTKRTKLGLDLMLEFTERLGDPEAMSEIQARFPAIAAIISAIPKSTRVEALRAKAEGKDLTSFTPHVDNFIARYDEANSGVRIDVGFTLRHERIGRQFVDDKDWPLVQDIRMGRARQPRFALTNDAWCEIFPGWQGFGVEDDVVDRLRLLGVAKRDVDTKSERLLGEKSVHIPAKDGVLVLDDICMRDKAKRMVTDGDRAFVRRLNIDGRQRDMFALPADRFLAMRGVSYDLPSHDADTILQRCRERLESRGMTTPELHKQRIDGADHICMPTDEALTLLAPSHPGDAAAQLTLKKFDYDPGRYDYDPELGVLLVQAAMLSYQDDETIRTHTQAWGFSSVETISETAGNVDAQAFAAYDDTRNTLLIAFRGSESREDFRADADFSSIDGASYGGGRVQEGFEVQLRALLPKLKATIDAHPDARIMLGGHSLGGAMAALFMGWCLKNGIHVDQVYTCGQPPVGDKAWQTNLERLVHERDTQDRPVNLFRYVFGTDPVPHAPKFTHAGTLLYIDDDGKLQDPKTFSLTTGFLSLVGHLWDSLDNSFLHHRCPSYLGIVRKNRSCCPATK